MKKFSIDLLGGLCGDPSVLCEVLNHSGSFLFDIGSIDSVSHKCLLKVRCVFISHTHIDHFIGFDRLLRVNIPHHREIFLSGPLGFRKNVQGKLLAYTWNLLSPGQVRYRVAEVGERGRVTEYILADTNSFVPEQINERSDSVVWNEGPVIVRGIPVDHGIPCIAYVLTVRGRPKVDVAKIESLGLAFGPWLGKLQLMKDIGNYGLLDIDGVSMNAEELAAEIFYNDGGRSLGYVTDLLFSKENLLKLKLGLPKVDVLVCEASFRKIDCDRAKARGHLTTYQAALLGAYLGAEELLIFHVSNIYGGAAKESQTEAEKYFRRFSGLGNEDLQSLIEAELAQ